MKNHLEHEIRIPQIGVITQTRLTGHHVDRLRNHNLVVRAGDTILMNDRTLAVKINRRLKSLV